MSSYSVAVVGAAGGVGSACAFALASGSSINHIVLFDVNHSLLQTHVMDLEQLRVAVRPFDVVMGEPGELSNSDVIVVTAAVPHQDGWSRSAFLTANYQVMTSVLDELDMAGWQGTLIIATNPVDPLVTQAALRLGSRGRVIGFTANDSTRLRFAIGEACGVAPHRVEAWAVGEHGDHTVALFSCVRIDGEPFALSNAQRDRALDYVRSWYQRWQDCRSGRTSTWMSGNGLAELVTIATRPTPTMTSVSTLLEGQYGINGVAATVPTLVGATTLAVEEWQLSDQELAQLQQAASVIAVQHSEITDNQ